MKSERPVEKILRNIIVYGGISESGDGSVSDDGAKVEEGKGRGGGNPNWGLRKQRQM